MNIPTTIGTFLAIRNIKGKGYSKQIKYPSKQDKKIIWVIYEYMDQNKNNAIINHYSKYKCMFHWKIKKFDLTVIRMIRSDLIQLKCEKEELIEWVDQSYQYSGLLGINDFYSILSLQEVEDIFNIKYLTIFKRLLKKLKMYTAG